YGLADQVIARAACERRQVRVICGDNRFDPYAVARLAKSRGVRPEAVLRSVLIARAFTAYQLSELVNRLDHSTTDLVVISGPCTTFFDEDVPIVDAARLFYRMLWHTVELSSAAMTLLLVQGEAHVSERRAYFLKDLCRASDVVLRLGSEHTFALENRRRVALPYLAALDRIRGD
ncbi:MAG TPA: hypothetical protein VLD57_09120, partial [Blastocatellia bacterium]|nr:hypothetical protein [Blastocatellia bacterium]